MDAAVFDTVVLGNGEGAATQGVTTQTTIALTMTNASANRPAVLMIGRDADNASDDDASLRCASRRHVRVRGDLDGSGLTGGITHDRLNRTVTASTGPIIGRMLVSHGHVGHRSHIRRDRDDAGGLLGARVR